MTQAKRTYLRPKEYAELNGLPWASMAEWIKGATVTAGSGILVSPSATKYHRLLIPSDLEPENFLRALKRPEQ